MDDLTEEKLGQWMTIAGERGRRQCEDIQDALAELLARKTIGEWSLAYLDKKDKQVR